MIKTFPIQMHRILTGDMDTHDDYVYQPLSEPSKTTRLIKILYITLQVTCRLEVVSLEDAPVFTALSYMWGDSSITEALNIEEHLLFVTVNLANALRDVYQQWSEGHLTAPAEEQWLWADALSINQRDVQEKNSHIPLMEVIYPTAHSTVSWLGIGNEETCLAIRAFSFVAQQISLSKYHTLLAKMLKNRNIQNLWRELGNETFNAITALDWLKNHYRRSEVDVSSHTLETFANLHKLLESPYWRRLWVLRELVLASNFNILCGTSTTSWVKVDVVYHRIYLFQKRHNASDQPTWMPHCEGYLMTIRVPNSPYWGVCTIKRLRAIIEPDAQRFQLRGDLTSGSKSEFIALIGVVIMNYAASDPKDYVYGTGGMSTLRVPADYSSATAVGDVYQEFAAYWLAWDHRAKGEIRSNTIGLEELCNLWFLEHAGIGYPWNHILE
jgi:hypothetical protein